MKLLHESPYRASGYVQMNAQTYCSTAVDDHDLWLALKKYNNAQNSWEVKRSMWKENVSQGVFHNWGMSTVCTTTTRRWWMAQVDGYAVMNGVLYGDTVAATNELNCNT